MLSNMIGRVHKAKSKGLRKIEGLRERRKSLLKVRKVIASRKHSDFLAPIQNSSRSISPMIFLDLGKFNGELYHTNAMITLLQNITVFITLELFLSLQWKN